MLSRVEFRRVSDNCVEILLIVGLTTLKFASVSLHKTLNCSEKWLQKFCRCGGLVMSSDIALPRLVVMEPGGWQGNVRMNSVAVMDCSTCVLYAYLSGWKCWSQSVWCSGTPYPRCTTIVLLNLSAFTLVWSWYVFDVKCLTPKHAAMAAKHFKTSCGPLPPSRYVSIPIWKTKLSQSTVDALVDGTVVTGLGLVSFVYRLVKRSTWMLNFVMASECPLSRLQAILRLEIEGASFGDGLLYRFLCISDNQLLWCTQPWSYKASNIYDAVYHKILSHPVPREERIAHRVHYACR